jgi:hypothetical protein
MAWEEPRKTGMQYRRLGNSGLHVSVLGLGGWLTYVSEYKCLDVTNSKSASVAMSRMVRNYQQHLTISSAKRTFSRTHIFLHETSLRVRYQFLRYSRKVRNPGFTECLVA